jgi:hypothetical protein
VASINEETDSAETIENGFTLYLLDLTTSELTLVLERDPRLLHPILWVSDHEVLLAGFHDYSCNADSLDFCDELYLLNITNNNIEEYSYQKQQ